MNHNCDGKWVVISLKNVLLLKHFHCRFFWQLVCFFASIVVRSSILSLFQVGPNAETTLQQLKPFTPKCAVLNAPRVDSVHANRSELNEQQLFMRKDTTLVSFPNDRAVSVRPSGTHFKLVLTGMYHLFEEGGGGGGC